MAGDRMRFPFSQRPDVFRPQPFLEKARPYHGIDHGHGIINLYSG